MIAMKSVDQEHPITVEAVPEGWPILKVETDPQGLPVVILRCRFVLVNGEILIRLDIPAEVNKLA